MVAPPCNFFFKIFLIKNNFIFLKSFTTRIYEVWLQLKVDWCKLWSEVRNIGGSRYFEIWIIDPVVYLSFSSICSTIRWLEEPGREGQSRNMIRKLRWIGVFPILGRTTRPGQRKRVSSRNLDVNAHMYN